MPDHLKNALYRVVWALHEQIGDGGDFETAVQDALQQVTGRPYILVTDRSGRSV